MLANAPILGLKLDMYSYALALDKFSLRVSPYYTLRVDNKKDRPHTVLFPSRPLKLVSLVDDAQAADCKAENNLVQAV